MSDVGCLPHCYLCDACYFSVDGLCFRVIVVVQVTRLETLEHNALVMVSSHSHLLQH